MSTEKRYELREVDARADERAKIAAWLRSRADDYPEDIFPPDWTSPDCISARALRQFAVIWAECIESGRADEGADLDE